MKTEVPSTIYLKDYKKSSYSIEKIHLTFDLDDVCTLVSSKCDVVRNPEASGGAPLVLNGEELTLKSIKINGEVLDSNYYEEKDNKLTIHEVPEKFTLEIENTINPSANKALDGLYKSGSIFCTQNEPEGFRRITYFIDRPDNMALFTTKVIADKKTFPVLLSNGNPIDSGDLDGGKHFVTWEDPFRKPSYLYALVAGDLGLVEDKFTTKSGREILLQIFVDKGNEDKCGHAMESLKNSMKWDEDRFGLEYDLDIYMIVAVDSFNMGAMENKGLNVFNSAYVLADSKTATDNNFLGVEGVIGHEYFHNWTGNRVTCRDWFQLTLKEGLTVFRDQEFSGDMNSSVVQRIADVQVLRDHQFSEDSGPTSHPIKPDHYMEINNFYTSTIYNKGAEVIRMIHTFLTEEGFQKGMRLYFERHDGQAVTTEDFVAAMSDANGGFDFSQFSRWYSQSGTPEVTIHGEYNETDKTLKLTLDQACPPTPGQDHKKPFRFPFALGLINADGKELPLKLKKSTTSQIFVDRGFLDIKESQEEFVFENVDSFPTLSLNRNFSAPVKVHASLSTKDWCHLLAHDSDEFNRYEASQVLGKRMVYHLLEQKHAGKNLEIEPAYIEAYGKFLNDQSLDSSVKAMSLALPSEKSLHQGRKPLDIEGIHEVRLFLKSALAQKYESTWLELYQSNCDEGEYKLDIGSMGRRSLKTIALSYLSELRKEETNKLLKAQFDYATNMTDEISALGLLCHQDIPERKDAIQKFYNKWKHETLVMQKWLSAQALSSLPFVLDEVLELEKSDIYDGSVPNLYRALTRSFAANYQAFHKADGSGYKFIADKLLEVDKLNPQMGASTGYAFMEYKDLPDGKKTLMKKEVERILAEPNLSKNAYEIVSKVLS